MRWRETIFLTSSHYPQIRLPRLQARQGRQIVDHGAVASSVERQAVGKWRSDIPRAPEARQIRCLLFEPTFLRYSNSHLSPLPGLQEIPGLSFPTARFALRGPQSYGPDRAYEDVDAFQRRCG